MVPLYILSAVAVGLVGWGIAVYNRLIRLRNLKDEGWSGIDVQLKRRSDLIPNLMETVKGYMQHEKEVLTEVTELRARVASAADPADRIKAEAALGLGLGRLLAVAESYPDLKANDNFLELQKQLQEVEDQIQMARRYYNGSVRNLNTAIEVFPNTVIASLFHFAKADFFELEDEGDRATPAVTFR